MTKPLKQWIEEDVAALKAKGTEYLYGEGFFRDPTKPIKTNPKYFYSPCDGIIIDQQVVKPDDEIHNIKGKSFTLKQLMHDDDFDEECLIINTYMSSYNVHCLRNSYSGIIDYWDSDPITTTNLPMLTAENRLLRSVLDYNNYEFLHTNSRRILRNYIPKMNYHYYNVYIADDAVDVILTYNDPGDLVIQSQRIGFIRFGSTTVSVLPIKNMPFTYKLSNENLTMVEAGIDPIIEIKWDRFKRYK